MKYIQIHRKTNTEANALVEIASLSALTLRAGTGDVPDWTQQQTRIEFRDNRNPKHNPNL